MSNNERMKQLELLAQGSYGQRIAGKAIVCMTIVICVFCVSCASVGGYVAFKTFEYLSNTETYTIEEFTLDDELHNSGNGNIINDSNITSSEVLNNGDN